MRIGGSAVAAVVAVSLLGCGGGDESTAYENPSEAMEPTIAVGEELEVNLSAYEDADPQVGDIVIFYAPAGADNGTDCGVQHPATQVCPSPTKDLSTQTFIKRVVALPEDELSIEDGYAVIDGERQDEPFAAGCGNGGSCNLPKPITVEADHYFMLGDNRGASDDSRYWGAVPKRAILGRVELDD